MQTDELNAKEFAILQIFSNPVLFREFINQDNPTWTPLEDHERAWSTCTSHFIAMCCGRSVHKTTSMIEMLYWWMINRMYNRGDDAGLFVLVPNQAQKNLSFDKVRTACLTHWLIKQFVNPNVINKTDGLISFKNGFVFMIRLAGESGKESNVIGVHVYRIWVDEAQGIPWQVWNSLQNCLKKEIAGYQLIVSGVPDGSREKNVLFECDQTDPDYISFNIAQTMMSWWTKQTEYEARKKYHAQVEDTEDYKHYVLGQHGMPSYSVFDRGRFLIEPYKINKLVITQPMIDRTKRQGKDGQWRYHLEELITCPPVPSEFGVRPRIGLGYDVGFSPDPAVFFVLVETPGGSWRNLVRYVFERIEYPIQREALAWLDSVYHFNFMGIDMGGPGKVQYQDLTGPTSDYIKYKFSERLFPVEFGSYMVVAIDEEGKEKKDQTKRVAVETLSRWVHERRLSFASEDINLMEELERTKFSRTMTGESVYRTSDDHQMAALMCAIMAYESKYGVSVVVDREPIVPKLLSARWLDTNVFGV